VRPRFNGFVRFFEAAGVEINRCLKGEKDDRQLIDSLNKLFSQASRTGGHPLMKKFDRAAREEST
jgi:hypothetical protein